MSLAYTVKQLREGIGELLEHQESTRSLGEFTRYADDPAGFIREVLGDEMTPPQAEVAAAVLTHPQTVVRGCHGSGKDWLGARLALWWVYARQGLALLTGPTERQVKEILMRREVRRAWRGNGLPGDLFEMALRLRDNEQTGILAFTASEADKFTGHHAPSVLIVITEGQGVEPEIYEAAQRVLTGENSRLLVVGNANRPVGRFYEIHRSTQWRKVRISAFDHPNVKAQREVIPGAVTLRWVEAMAEEYGESSSFYKAAVLAEFPEDADEALVQRRWLERAAERWACGFSADDEHLTFSVDPARFGADKTALVIRRGRRLLETILWAKKDTMATVGEIQAHMRRYGARVDRLGAWAVPTAYRSLALDYALVVDVVGLGSGVVDRLAEQGFRPHAFNGGGSPEGADAERFHNKRAEAYWTLRKLLEEDRIDLPEDPLLWEELQATRWRTSSKGKIQIEPKELLKAQIGRSPDRADAVSMAFWAEAFGPAPQYTSEPYTTAIRARI